MATVDLPHGTLHYHQAGSGPPIVFLHGYLQGANLWDPVVQLLAGEFRCITPELPFGAHPTPMRPDADLTTAGVGRLVTDFLAALDLHQVILVGNDSGDAIAQVVAARHPQRLGGLVLATCDAFMGQVAAELAGFRKPVLLAWATDDKFFPLAHARRLTGILPDARLEPIEGSRTWVMRDQPQRTAQLIGHFARHTTTQTA